MLEYKKFIKVVFVGDSNVGKTCFISSYLYNRFPLEVSSTLFDSHNFSFELDGVDYEITLWDTAGKMERKKLRKLAYPKTNVFVICYSIGNRASYENVEYKWIPEIRRNQKHAPVILLGLKKDTRRRISYPVTPSEGKLMSLKIGALQLFEHSYLSSQKRAHHIFTHVVQAGLREKKGSCSATKSCSIT